MKAHVIRWFAIFALGTLLLIRVGYAQEAIAAENPGTLPFSVSVKTRPLNLDIVSFYIDSPLRQVVMDGGVWVMGVQPDPYHNPISVLRWKGPDFEHMVRQPDGAADFSQRTASSFLNSGLWYNKANSTLYALVHGEYEGQLDSAWCRKKTWLATSNDLGLHWKFVGDVVTATLPNLGDRLKYSGSEFEMGTADYDLYVDTRGGYFYATFWNGFVAKHGIINHLTAGTVQVARCAIKDKMAPGKWYKFCNGTWTQPGLGGKASDVAMTSFGLYGNTIYSTYLEKYVRIGVNVGCGDPRWPNVGMRDTSVYISTCTDLARQDWTPMAKLADEPTNPFFGFTLASENAIDPSTCGQTLHVYNYWEKKGRILDITFNKGVTPEAPFPEHGSYSYEPHPESGDRVNGRQTKIVGCASSDIRYDGSGWSMESNPLAYQGQVKECRAPGNSLEFFFRGAEIYWRAIPEPDGGKADVFIDGQLQKTVDLYFWDTPLTFQFAFIKTGLDPAKTHTIKIVSRGDKNPRSSGTLIKHMAFEYSAESYWAAAGFSGVFGKNNWRYGSRQDTTDTFLIFDTIADVWSNSAGCSVGHDDEVSAGGFDADRKWVAPHAGMIRIEGAPALDPKAATGCETTVLKNADKLWSAQLTLPDKPTSSHDATVTVQAGDAISFVAHQLDPAKASKILWDPVITYVDGTTAGK
jgi:hypothetical protein